MKAAGHLELAFVTAKDPGSGQWGVAMLHAGEVLARWSPEEALAEAANIERKAKLCFRQGLLPV